jgi:hypothetical protein
MLAEREKQLPADYNPPARLARVLVAAKRLPEAEAAIDRALGKMTRGPRRLRVLQLKAEIRAARGEPTAAVLREALEVLRALPATQRRPAEEHRLEEELARAR